MKLVLYRDYHPAGTNGDLYVDEVFQCHTIELPWLDNQHQQSCIPEGTYRLEPRWNQRFGKHLLVRDVPGRSAILVHPANNALTELKGCIAPVLQLTGAGCGSYSRMALEHLLQVLAMHPDEPMELTITNNHFLTNKTKSYEPDQTHPIDNTSVL